MNAVMRFLFSIPPDRAADADSWYIRFLSPWDAGVSVIIAVCLAAVLILTYAKQPKRMPGWAKTCAALCRFAAAAGIIIMLWRPAVTFENIITEKPYLIFIADKSLSMDIEDIPAAEGMMSRDAAVSRLYSRIADSARMKDFNTAVFTVGSGIKRTGLSESASIPADQHMSDIYTLSMEILHRYAGKPVAEVFILTDGNSTGGTADESDFSRFLGDEFRENSVNIVGVGSRSLTVDVKAEELIAPRNVLMKEKVEAVFRYSVHGTLGSRLPVILEENGKEVGRDHIPAETQKGIISFSYRPQTRGDILLTARTGSAEGEIILANNYVSQMITVYQGTLKVLYIEGKPRWEYRYLKNSMVRDKMISVSILLLSADPRFRQEGDVPINEFPSKDELEKYDTIIIGDVSASAFTDRQLLSIAECVEKKGTGLVCIPRSSERAASYINTPIEDILPVTLVKTEVFSVFEEKQTLSPFKPKIPRSAWEHPVMQLGEDNEQNRSVWDSLPPFYSFVRTEGLKAGRTLLAENPVRSSLEKPDVIFAAGFYGLGKCFFSAVDSTWRWRFRVGDLHFYRFWMNVFRYVSSGRFAEGRSPCFIITDSTHHTIGRQVYLTALIRDNDFKPVNASEWEITIEDPEGSQKNITLKASAEARGYYKGGFYPERRGIYRISAENPEGLG
mgnify:FL=1